MVMPSLAAGLKEIRSSVRLMINLTHDLDGDLLPLGGLDETLGEAAGGLVRHPAGLLGIVRFGLQHKAPV